MSEQLSKRNVWLTIAFTMMATLLGYLEAPPTVAPLGACIGFAIGFPVAVALAGMLRKKRPLLSVVGIGVVTLVLWWLVPHFENLINPVIQIGLVLLAGMVLSLVLPFDKSLYEKNLCKNCGYPIGTSPVCTECGAAILDVQPRKGDGK